MTLRSPLLLLRHMPYSGDLPSAMRTIRCAFRRHRCASPILLLLLRRLHRSVRKGMRLRSWRGRSRCTHQTGIGTVNARLRPQHRTHVSIFSSWNIIQHPPCGTLRLRPLKPSRVVVESGVSTRSPAGLVLPFYCSSTAPVPYSQSSLLLTSLTLPSPYNTIAQLDASPDQCIWCQWLGIGHNSGVNQGFPNLTYDSWSCSRSDHQEHKTRKNTNLGLRSLREVRSRI